MQNKSSASILVVGIKRDDELGAIERHSVPESRRLNRFLEDILLPVLRAPDSWRLFLINWALPWFSSVQDSLPCCIQAGSFRCTEFRRLNINSRATKKRFLNLLSTNKFAQISCFRRNFANWADQIRRIGDFRFQMNFRRFLFSPRFLSWHRRGFPICSWRNSGSLKARSCRFGCTKLIRRNLNFGWFLKILV